MKCSQCKRSFPDHLVNSMAIGIKRGVRYVSVCPMCALKFMQDVHGSSFASFSPGSRAQAMLEEAKILYPDK